jgi:hypothetical protein
MVVPFCSNSATEAHAARCSAPLPSSPGVVSSTGDDQPRRRRGLSQRRA